MSRIRSKETLPERRVREFVRNLGLRYRKNVKSLPGKPDHRRIGGISVVPSKGVKVEDRMGQLAAWIECARDEDATRIRDELIRSVEAAERDRRYQPDWSFLNPVAAIRPAKLA